ncbi:uncharacterized protein VP01_571g3 [Puccinia sorghi]|uniref:DDE Tnp4 domain-containing protein n=1 Tax=Puccinia sorghi TaxID=27349 RepID=A0A0L6UJC3_9BASI|nr:uncharacterized protein VP01_571g3 [Puccinia sorghi]
MLQQPSQHKQLLQAAMTQTWKITLPFVNTNTRNNTLQPAPQLNFTHDKICLPFKAFLNPASIKFYIPYSTTNLQILNEILNNLFKFGYGTINLYTTQELVKFSQVIQEGGFPGCIGFLDGTIIPLIQKPSIDGNHYFDCKKRSDTQFHSLLFVMLRRTPHPIKPAIQDHAMISMYSKTYRFLSSPKSSLMFL